MRKLIWTLLIFVAACGGDNKSSSAPSSTQSSINISGAWSGTAADSTGPGKLNWQIIQNGTLVSGTITVTDTRTNVSGKGTISGTLNGIVLTFTMSIPAGGLPAPFSSCVITTNGTATNVTSSSMNGVYSGNNSCSGAFNNGTFTMVKQ